MSDELTPGEADEAWLLKQIDATDDEIERFLYAVAYALQDGGDEGSVRNEALEQLKRNRLR